MGNVQGKKQCTLYVDPMLHKLMQVIALKRGDVALYTIVDEAFRTKVEKELTVAELKMFGYDKSKKKVTNGATSSRSQKGKASTSGSGAKASAAKRDGKSGKKSKARRR